MGATYIVHISTIIRHALARKIPSTHYIPACGCFAEVFLSLRGESHTVQSGAIQQIMGGSEKVARGDFACRLMGRALSARVGSAETLPMWF
jgi:hypothetical protein